MSRHPKTVYFLGAGFSSYAKLPLQHEILDRVRASEIDLMSAPRSAGANPRIVSEFQASMKLFQEFLRRTFPVGTTPRLEDVFTLLDQTVSRRESCSGYSWTKLEEIQSALKRVILHVFYCAEDAVPGEARVLYEGIALKLLLSRLVSQAADPIAVISSNWDCLLENIIMDCLKAADYERKADIDYCCYTTPLGESCPHRPSIQQKPAGIYNFKVLKLHGSANWLVCPTCKRLFTGIGSNQDVWDLYVRPTRCKKCFELGFEGSEEPANLCLEPFFITPTFLKVFNTPHIQTVWHNAFIDLTEASRVIFIGYSLPAADYHVRTLLRRAIRPDTEIDVILVEGDNPKLGGSNSDCAGARYEEFFGPVNVNIRYDGVEGFFHAVATPDHLQSKRAELAKTLKDADPPRSS